MAWRRGRRKVGGCCDGRWERRRRRWGVRELLVHGSTLGRDQPAIPREKCLYACVFLCVRNSWFIAFACLLKIILQAASIDQPKRTNSEDITRILEKQEVYLFIFLKTSFWIYVHVYTCSLCVHAPLTVLLLALRSVILPYWNKTAGLTVNCYSCHTNARNVPGSSSPSPPSSSHAAGRWPVWPSGPAGRSSPPPSSGTWTNPLPCHTSCARNTHREWAKCRHFDHADARIADLQMRVVEHGQAHWCDSMVESKTNVWAETVGKQRHASTKAPEGLSSKRSGIRGWFCISEVALFKFLWHFQKSSLLSDKQQFNRKHRQRQNPRASHCAHTPAGLKGKPGGVSSVSAQGAERPHDELEASVVNVPQVDVFVGDLHGALPIQIQVRGGH